MFQAPFRKCPDILLLVACWGDRGPGGACELSSLEDSHCQARQQELFIHFKNSMSILICVVERFKAYFKIYTL